MIVTIYPIYGFSLGVQVTGGHTEEDLEVNIILVDIFVFTLQFAWGVKKELP